MSVFLSGKYKNVSRRELNNIQNLFILSLILAFAILTVAFVLLVDKPLIARVAIGVLGLFYLLTAFLVYRGKAQFASKLIMPLLWVIIMFINIVLISNPSDTYLYLVIGLLFLLITNLIASRFRETLLTAIVLLTAQVIGILKLSEWSVSRETIPLIFRQVFYIGLFIGVNSRYNSGINLFIRQTENAAGEFEKQASRSKDMLSMMNENLKIGDQLVASSEVSRFNIGTLGENISTLKERFIDQKMSMDTYVAQMNKTVAETHAMRTHSASQSSAIEESSSAVHEMAASLKNLAELSKSRGEIMENLQEVTESGGKQVAQSNAAIGEMDGKSRAIIEIVDVIMSVADQINLLAMNAAIEAAHAGDKGRGFAVVASEIRKLAEQTNQQVDNIHKAVEMNQESIKQVVEYNDHVTQTFQILGDKINIVISAFREILSSLQEISAGTGEMQRAVSHLLDTNALTESSIDSLERAITGASEHIKALKELNDSNLSQIEGVDGSMESLREESEKVTHIGRENRDQIQTMNQTIESWKTES